MATATLSSSGLRTQVTSTFMTCTPRCSCGETALEGAGIDVAVADLDDDGEFEIVVATANRLVVYGRAPLGFNYLERASIAVEDVSDLLVSDLNGDDEMEIYALQYSDRPATISVYDDELRELRSLPLGLRAGSLFAEDSSFRRKNLLVGTHAILSTTGGIRAIDPLTGAEVWRSPPLSGSVPPNSLHFVDVDGDGNDEISFATSFGMFVTR